MSFFSSPQGVSKSFLRGIFFPATLNSMLGCRLINRAGGGGGWKRGGIGGVEGVGEMTSSVYYSDERTEGSFPTYIYILYRCRMLDHSQIIAN